MTAIQRLNRALIGTLTRTPEAAATICDRIEELEGVQAENDKLRAVLQEIADEAVKHHEYNPVSGKDRLPIGYKNILNIADRALCRSNTP